jgi:hypothetical protein
MYFFYNGAGTAAVVTYLQGGWVERQPWTSTGLSPWTSIVQNDDYLMFYNFHTGLLAVAAFSAVDFGLLQSATQSTLTMDTGDGWIAPVGDNVLGYNSTTGAYQIVGAYISDSGINYAQFRSSGTLPKFYSPALRCDGRYVLYSYGSGDTTIAYIGQTGTLVKIQRTMLPLYTAMVSTGENIVGYNASTGELDVFAISQGGTLVAVSTQIIAAGYSSLVATHS